MSFSLQDSDVYLAQLENARQDPLPQPSTNLLPPVPRSLFISQVNETQFRLCAHVPVEGVTCRQVQTPSMSWPEILVELESWHICPREFLLRNFQWKQEYCAPALGKSRAKSTKGVELNLSDLGL